ncbi:aspartic proteinase Asp1-like [Phoenix dactylifera]|uniref:Aspartic proteinase Asp1-like n=1 Tax=Phoenix dactylifera TaxID=42345 RepID=A0A8B7CW39_PHODC|nr:aspartic proteinase Asp1-like [Phoenix dactylifera]
MGGKGAVLLVALLVAASDLAAILSCSAAANLYATALPMKPKASPPPQIDAGHGVGAYLPLQGNVYPQGKFYVQISFGNSQNFYSLDIDTGSDVPWVQCEVPPQAVYPRPPMDKLIPCDDPRCRALHASAGARPCKSPERCDFLVQYVDDSAEGVLIADTLTLRLTNGSIVHPLVAFGCGRWRNDKDRATTDGMLGLGSGEISILSQLSSQGVFGKLVAHCLGSRGGGFFFMGDDMLPSGKVTWAPMTRSFHYSPGPASLFWGNQPLGSNLMVLLDSGTTYTYFGLQPYNNFISTLNGHVSKQPLTRAYDDHWLPYCWRGPRPFSSIADAQGYFKQLELRFADGAASMKIPPANYLIISEHHNACLGILNGTEEGLQSNINLIGDISMLDLLVVYDNDKQRIGWASADCSRAFKSATYPLE